MDLLDEAVEDADVVAFREQRAVDVAADETCAAGHENFQRRTPLKTI
jgi:hypothetical protein